MRNFPSITKERFFQILEAYGGHPKRWPAEERQAVLQFLEQSEEAKKVYQQACQLDQLLECVPPPPRMLKNSLLTAMFPPSQSVPSYKPYFLRPVMIFLLFFLLGIVIGFTLTTPSTPLPWDEEGIYLLAFNEDIP